jgi:hypothetical protein
MTGGSYDLQFRRAMALYLRRIGYRETGPNA